MRLCAHTRFPAPQQGKARIRFQPPDLVTHRAMRHAQLCRSAAEARVLNMSGSPWPLVFLLMASTCVLCGVLIFFVKA